MSDIPNSLVGHEHGYAMEAIQKERDIDEREETALATNDIICGHFLSMFVANKRIRNIPH
jgi:hypothetical protein